MGSFQSFHRVLVCWETCASQLKSVTFTCIINKLCVVYYVLQTSSMDSLESKHTHSQACYESSRLFFHNSFQKTVSTVEIMFVFSPKWNEKGNCADEWQLCSERTTVRLSACPSRRESDHLSLIFSQSIYRSLPLRMPSPRFSLGHRGVDSWEMMVLLFWQTPQPRVM